MNDFNTEVVEIPVKLDPTQRVTEGDRKVALPEVPKTSGNPAGATQSGPNK